MYGCMDVWSCATGEARAARRGRLGDQAAARDRHLSDRGLPATGVDRVAARELEATRRGGGEEAARALRPARGRVLALLHWYAAVATAALLFVFCFLYLLSLQVVTRQLSQRTFLAFIFVHYFHYTLIFYTEH